MSDNDKKFNLDSFKISYKPQFTKDAEEDKSRQDTIHDCMYSHQEYWECKACHNVQYWKHDKCQKCHKSAYESADPNDPYYKGGCV
jgi:hypothetical protein